MEINDNQRKKALRKAKEILRDYPAAKLRIDLYPKKRPTLMKQMKVDLSGYEEAGIAEFDRNLYCRLDTDDWFFMDQYFSDLENNWIINQVLSWEDETTRGLIQDLYENEKTCKELEKKYSLNERTIRWRVNRVVNRIADLLP